MDSRLDFESERASPGFFGEVDLGSKPGLPALEIPQHGYRADMEALPPSVLMVLREL